ncbi:MAG: RNA polymerase sigma factor [Spirochaetes bacterium]|nr:RNA polymerase sigma factor [Spirochaetota bacterium]
MTENEFAALFRETKKIVLSAIGRHLSRQYSHYIDDVVQETYIRFVRNADKKVFPDERSRNNYLYTIAKNESLRASEKLRREEIKANKAIKADLVKESREDTAGDENYEFLHEYISKLPSKYRDVVSLLAEGRSEKEISEKLDIKCGTVKSRSHRARAMLKELMEDDNYEFTS